jgi:hypothetical protein
LCNWIIINTSICVHHWEENHMHASISFLWLVFVLSIKNSGLLAYMILKLNHASLKHIFIKERLFTNKLRTETVSMMYDLFIHNF